MNSSQPTHKHPVLLFPLRLETRFDGSDLLVRIYPDDVLVHARDERLSPAESQALHQYVAAVRKAGGKGNDLAAWRGLVARVGRRRAAYLTGFSEVLSEFVAKTELAGGEGDAYEAGRTVVEQVGPGRAAELLGISDSDPVGIRGVSHSGVPRASLLPERYVAYLYDEAGNFDREVKWTADLKGRELPLFADPEAAAGEADLLFMEQAAWIGDFTAAERVGMAVRIPDTQDHYSRLIVIGLNGDDAQQGGDDLTSLLEAHRFSSGIALVPYGTPTNNTAEIRSGYADDEEEADQSYEIECCATDIDQSTLGGQLADALGITSTSLKSIGRSGDKRGDAEEAVRTLLWPALGGYFLKHMLPDPLGSNPNDRIKIWDYFRRFVDARGPLSSIRVGKQPYGIVPVTGIRDWEWSLLDSGASPDMKYGKKFEETLHSVLRELFERWLDIADKKPDLVPRIGQSEDPDKELLEVLAMQPSSVNVHLRALVDDRFMGWIFPKLGEEDIRAITPTDCGSLENCTQWWVDRYQDEHRESKLLLEQLDAAAGGASPKLNEAKILDVYAWTEESSALDASEMTLVADSTSPNNPLEYLSNFAIKSNEDNEDSVPPPAVKKPLLYDLLRRSRLYEDSPFVTGPSSGNVGVFNKALDTLAKTSVIDLEGLVRDVLDLHAHRLDAWTTSLATRRLLGMRQAGAGASSGICTGAYGWVEDLQREDRVTADKAGGYIHAPSCAQAAAAAVLRNTYLTHADDENGNAYRINLSSERVRRAWRVLRGIREGQELGALLGYQFERGLHDTGNDRYIDAFRRLYPVTAHEAREPILGDSKESVVARNVVEGLSLARDWIMYHEQEAEDTGDQEETEKRKADLAKKRAELKKKWEEDELDGLLDLSDKASVEQRLTRDQLERLSDTMDAVFDLLTYESVYQQVQGNYERSAAALDAMEGVCPPPEPESIQTPLAGAAFNQRVCMLLQAADGGWGEPSAVQTRATSEPTLAGWFAEILGDMEEIGCLARVTTYHNDAGELYQPLDLNAATLAELAALTPIGEIRAQDIVADRTANGPFPKVMALTRVPGVDEDIVKSLIGAVAVIAPQVVRLSDLGIDPIDFLYLCASSPEGLLSSLGFCRPKVDDQRAGETELEARIKYYVRGENWLGPNCEVAIDFGPQATESSRSFAEAIEVSRSVLALVSGVCCLKPASLSPPGASAETGDAQAFRKRDYKELNRRLGRACRYLKHLDCDDFFAISRFGIGGAIPPSPVCDPEVGPRRAKMEKAVRQRLIQYRYYRIEAHRLFKAETFRVTKAPNESPPDYDEAVKMLVEAMKSLFGGEFVVLPTLSGSPEELRFDEKALAIQDEQRIHLWLQQAAQTHPAVRKLEDTLLAVDAWQTPAVTQQGDWDELANEFTSLSHNRLRVAQLTEGDVPYWLALSDAEIAAAIPAEKLEEVRAEIAEYGWPNGALSLTCWVPQPIDRHKKVTGLLIDKWDELIPSAKRATGISFQYDGPNTQAPQALLLAVPSTSPGNHAIHWLPEELREIVSDTLDLAKVRAVDVDALDKAIGGLVPANVIPSVADNRGWARGFKPPMPGLADAVKATLEKVLTGTIEIMALDVRQTPLGAEVADVEVGVSGVEETKKTDANGKVIFDDVPIGTHTITAFHSSYKQLSVSVNVSFSQKQAVTLRLSLLPGTIKGKITARYKRQDRPRPARGAQVTLTSSTTGTRRTDGSGSDGSYQFSDLMPGPYNIKAEFMPRRYEGCKTDSQDVILGEGGVVKTVNLGLDCVPDLPRPKGGLGRDPEIP